MRDLPRRRIWLAAIGVLALVGGPFATSQLTHTAERSPALLLADLAVGWSMIAAGLLIADRRPGNRIGPLAILTGFAWFAGDFTSSDVAVVSYLATLAHGWFDPLFALVILAYPTGRIIRGVDRFLAIGFIAVQAGWTIAKAIGMRPIAWWDCPTCISTVDAWFTAYLALDPIGRVETLLLTALSVGVLMVVVARWQRATGTARQRLAPVVLAGAVLAGGFVVTFLLQTIVPTSAREPLGELRVIVLADLARAGRDRTPHRRLARRLRAWPDRGPRRPPGRAPAVAGPAGVAAGRPGRPLAEGLSLGARIRGVRRCGRPAQRSPRRRRIRPNGPDDRRRSISRPRHRARSVTSR